MGANIISPPSDTPSEYTLVLAEFWAKILALKLATNAIQNTGFCYYHRRFYPKALKCQSPCSWEATTAGKARNPTKTGTPAISPGSISLDFTVPVVESGHCIHFLVNSRADVSIVPL